MDRGDIEAYVRTAPIVEQGPLTKGGGHPDKQLAVLEGGVGVVVKLALPGDRVKHDQVRAECAAGLLANALGWQDLVPATALRVVESITTRELMPASVQVVWPLFMPAAELHRDASSCPPKEIWRAAIFDALALNTDRHALNWGFVEGMPETPRLIDHGHAFEAATSGSFDFINLRRGQDIPDDLVNHIDERIVKPGLPPALGELRPQNVLDRIMDLADTFVRTRSFTL